MPEINFVSHQAKKLSTQQKKDQLYFRYALGVFVFILGVFLLSLIVFVYVKSQLDNSLKQEKQLENLILGQENIEKSLLISNAKLEVLVTLFKDRFDKQAAMSFFSNLFGEQVLIKDMNYEAEDKILSLSLNCKSVFELERVLNLLSSPEVSARFGQVNKSQLKRDSAGKYNLTLTINLISNNAKK